MVQADALTPEAIMDAMDKGLFYASQGPRIHQLTVEDGMFTVRCSPVSRVYFYSNLVWGGPTSASVEAASPQRNTRWIRVWANVHPLSGDRHAGQERVEQPDRAVGANRRVTDIPLR